MTSMRGFNASARKILVLVLQQVLVSINCECHSPNRAPVYTDGLRDRHDLQAEDERASVGVDIRPPTRASNVVDAILIADKGSTGVEGRWMASRVVVWMRAILMWDAPHGMLSDREVLRKRRAHKSPRSHEWHFVRRMKMNRMKWASRGQSCRAWWDS
ncbi:hypothetical protein B0H21DRAFT_503219 [Amylocystis lapponica]|nr:hypothetical protein B0H21DRAFT_503219 [Amylocystis lapponica]